MFNPRISGIAAGTGFILSFLLGLITGAGFPLLLIRALIFAAVFFALAGAGYWAIKTYLPDLLGSPGEGSTLGAQVDISVGDDAPGDGLDEFMENPGETGENMDSLQGNTLDQNSEDGYTEMGNLEETPDSFTPVQFGAAPEMDSPAEGLTGGLASTESLFDIEAKDAPEKKGLEGDFNAQEMASAIQTILKREDKG